MSDKERDELAFNCFMVALATLAMFEVVAWITGQQAPIEYLWRLIMGAMG